MKECSLVTYDERRADAYLIVTKQSAGEKAFTWNSFM